MGTPPEASSLYALTTFRLSTPDLDILFLKQESTIGKIDPAYEKIRLALK
jgi:hypothetical protein